MGAKPLRSCTKTFLSFLYPHFNHLMNNTCFNLNHLSHFTIAYTNTLFICVLMHLIQPFYICPYICNLSVCFFYFFNLMRLCRHIYYCGFVWYRPCPPLYRLISKLIILSYQSDRLKLMNYPLVRWTDNNHASFFFFSQLKQLIINYSFCPSHKQ